MRTAPKIGTSQMIASCASRCCREAMGDRYTATVAATLITRTNNANAMTQTSMRVPPVESDDELLGEHMSRASPDHSATAAATIDVTLHWNRNNAWLGT